MKQDKTPSFDGEYGLSDLLPRALAEKLRLGMELGGRFSAFITFPDSTPFCPETQAESQFKEPPCCVLPILFESEPIGWLSLYSIDESCDESMAKLLAGFFILCMSQIMTFRYREMAMADLHGQVVEDSYAILEQKILQLEESEARYRDLAENLSRIVEKKSEEIQITQTRMMQQEKMASIGRLAAGIAHEINNPTGFIISNLYTLKDYENGLLALVARFDKVAEMIKGDISACVDEIRCRLEEIEDLKQDIDLDFILSDAPNLIRESQEGAERIKKIVADLKDFARPGESDFKYTDINKNLDLTLSVMTNELKYNATIIRHYGELPQVMCQPNHINQVFLNILSNAAQSIKGQGEITIETQAKNGHVTISISDTGCGIPQENLQRIFDPFFSTKEVGKGTGLGLNMAYNIIKSHGGEIDVTSQIGKGARFLINLPVHPKASEPGAKAESKKG